MSRYWKENGFVEDHDVMIEGPFPCTVIVDFKWTIEHDEGHWGQTMETSEPPHHEFGVDSFNIKGVYDSEGDEIRMDTFKLEVPDWKDKIFGQLYDYEP